MRVGFLHSLIRKEEKLLLEAFARHGGAEVVMLDDRKMIFDLKDGPDVDVVMERCINHSRALHGLRLIESRGVRCVNSYAVANVCGDKLLTSLALEEAGLPQPAVRIAFTEASALEALDDIGYPAVLKPAVGSWGRLLSKVNDRDAAESILEPQDHPRQLPPFHLLHPGVRPEERSRHPQLRRGGRVHRRHLPRLGALDHEHRPRRPRIELSGDRPSWRRSRSPRPVRWGVASWPSTCSRRPTDFW